MPWLRMTIIVYVHNVSLTLKLASLDFYIVRGRDTNHSSTATFSDVKIVYQGRTVEAKPE